MLATLPSLRIAQVFYILVFLCVLSFSLSYDLAFVHVEQLDGTKREHLRTGPSLTGKDILRMFDTYSWEGAGRPTRPLSTLLDITDTKFRAFCWKFFAPRPGLSLTWIFSMGLGPLLLIAFLLKLKVDPAMGWLAGAFYLSSQSVISLACMHFRSGKPMVNFFLLGLLWMASHFSSHQKKRPAEKKGHYFPFVIFALVTSFLFDETALIGYPMLLYFFPALYKNKTHKKILVGVPFFMAGLYFWFFPNLTRWLGFRGLPRLNGYIYEEVVGRGELQKVFYRLIMNNCLLVRDNLALFSPFQPEALWLKALLALNWGLWIVFFVLAFQLYRENKIRKAFPWIWKFGLFSIAVAVGHTLLHGGHLVSPFRYGTFFMVFFSIWLALLAKQLPRNLAVATFLVTIVASLVSIPYTIRVHKGAVFYEAGLTLEQAGMNRFTHTPQRFYSDVGQATREYWTHPERLFEMPANNELSYLKSELRPGFVIPMLDTSRAKNE